MLPWGSFTSNLYFQLEYYTGEFQELQLFILVALGPVDLALASYLSVHDIFFINIALNDNKYASLT